MYLYTVTFSKVNVFFCPRIIKIKKQQRNWDSVIVESQKYTHDIPSMNTLDGWNVVAMGTVFDE